MGVENCPECGVDVVWVPKLEAQLEPACEIYLSILCCVRPLHNFVQSKHTNFSSALFVQTCLMNISDCFTALLATHIFKSCIRILPAQHHPGAIVGVQYTCLEECRLTLLTFLHPDTHDPRLCGTSCSCVWRATMITPVSTASSKTTWCKVVTQLALARVSSCKF